MRALFLLLLLQNCFLIAQNRSYVSVEMGFWGLPSRLESKSAPSIRYSMVQGEFGRMIQIKSKFIDEFIPSVYVRQFNCQENLGETELLHNIFSSEFLSITYGEIGLKSSFSKKLSPKLSINAGFGFGLYTGWSITEAGGFGASLISHDTSPPQYTNIEGRSTTAEGKIMTSTFQNWSAELGFGYEIFPQCRVSLHYRRFLQQCPQVFSHTQVIAYNNTTKANDFGSFDKTYHFTGQFISVGLVYVFERRKSKKIN